MKALCVSGMPNPTGPTPQGTPPPPSRRDEAHALAKKALTLRVSSHVCWHVYGLLHRADRNYPEAIKCYKRALKLEPLSLKNGGDGQILRDLSHLQIQERDVEGFVESRSALLAARPGQRHNWLPLAVGHHLTGVLAAAAGGGGALFLFVFCFCGRKKKKGWVFFLSFLFFSLTPNPLSQQQQL